VAGHWKIFRACILAPREYLKGTKDVEAYDRQLSYEEVRDWFSKSGQESQRASYKVRILNQAIEQSGGRRSKHDLQVTRFWRDYWLCASKEFPELEMREPEAKPAGASWIEFRPTALGQRRRIYHKLDSAVADLQLDDAASFVESLRSNLQCLLADDTKVVQTGKSASVRIEVPHLDRFREFNEQLDKARAGLRAAYRLLFLSRAIPGNLTAS
jgi:hypothetical protein